MLDMGFIPDIERIFNLTPFTRQTLFFSATMPAEITRLTEAFLHNPERIEVARQSTASETIEQMVCMHTPKGRLGADKEKRDLLQRLIEDEGDSLTNAIVFCNRKRDVDVVMKALKKGGMNAAAIHGDLEQSERMRVLAGFRDNQIRIMVASDVAARGLDIPTVSHVYNYDVPIHAEDYVHRIGRTGRAGRWGKSITLCFPHEQKHLEKIEELLKLPIKPMVNPLGGAAAPEAEAPAPAPTSRRRAPAAAKASPAAPEPAPVVEQAAETVVEAVAAPAPAPAPETADAEPKRKRTRAPSRRRKTEDVTEVETPPAAAETVAEAPAAAVEAAPEAEAERPARAPRVSRRRARNKAEETTEAAPEATVDAPAPETAAEADAADAQPAPSRRSRGGRGGRTRGEPRAEAKAAPKPEPRAETKPAPKAEPQVDAKPEPRHESRAEQSRAPAPRGDQRGDQRGGNRVQTSAQTNARRDRGGRIIGMGDHVPAFMQQEIDVQALIRASSRADDKDEVAPASDAA